MVGALAGARSGPRSGSPVGRAEAPSARSGGWSGFRVSARSAALARGLAVWALLAAVLVLGLPAEAGAGNRSIQIVNASKEAYCYAYLSPRGQENWTELSFGTSCMGPGETWRLPLVDDTVGQWDLRLRNDSGDYRDYPPIEAATTIKLTLLDNGLCKVN